MNGSIAPTRISDSTASSAGGAEQHDDRRPGPSRPGPPWPSGSPWPPSVALGFVNWKTSDSDVARRSGAIDDEHRLLDERALRRVARREREDRRDEQPDRGEDEQRRVRAGDLRAERLGPVAQAAEQDARAEDEQQVADDRAGDRRLDDLDQAGLEREERDDQLGDVAERRVEDAADLRPGERPEALGRQADDPGQPEDRRRRRRRRERRVGVEAEVEDDRGDADDDGADERDPRRSGRAGPRIGMPPRAAVRRRSSRDILAVGRRAP